MGADPLERLIRAYPLDPRYPRGMYTPDAGEAAYFTNRISR